MKDFKLNIYAKIKDSILWIIVFGLFFVGAVFIPMIDTVNGFQLNFPESTLELASFLIVRAIGSFLSVGITYSLYKQGKQYALLEIEYQQAVQKYNSFAQINHKLKEEVIDSPQKHETKNRISLAFKLVTNFIGLTVCLAYDLTYNPKVVITYLFMMIMSFFMGLISMVNNKEYWCIDYPKWVDKFIELETLKMEEKNNDKNTEQCLQKSSRTSSEE